MAVSYGSGLGFPLIQSLDDIIKSIDLSICMYFIISFATFLLQFVTIHILYPDSLICLITSYIPSIILSLCIFSINNLSFN